jgi:hypothetical protein
MRCGNVWQPPFWRTRGTTSVCPECGAGPDEQRRASPLGTTSFVIGPPLDPRVGRPR